MGSGLILLVIVAAWLAVLVPMALRSHESSTSLSSVDRFSDAMRVLSRRDAVARARARREADDDPLSAAAYADNGDDDWDDWDDDVEHPGWRERLGGWRRRASSATGRLPRGSGDRRPSSPAVRRRRILLALLTLTAGCLAGGALGGPRELLYAGGALAGVVVLFVLQLRRLAVQRAERTRRSTPAAPRRRPAPAPASVPAVPAARAGSVRVQPASVPEPAPVPARVADDQLFDASLLWDDAPPVGEEPAAPAAAPEEPLPVGRPWQAAPAAALGGAWSPVPVPPPTYVTAPVASRRAPRIVDLTRPGAWSQAEARAAADRAGEQLPGTAPRPEPAADRRRAVNDW